VAGKYLEIEIVRLGAMFHDDIVKKSIIAMTPFMISYPDSQAGRDVRQIAENLSANKYVLNSSDRFVKKMLKLLR
jgi:MinD-like ATPase involved in chromosome partitioning or flagellar assembly